MLWPDAADRGKDRQRDKKTNGQTKREGHFINPAGRLKLVLHYNSTGVDDDKHSIFFLLQMNLLGFPDEDFL